MFNVNDAERGWVRPQSALDHRRNREASRRYAESLQRGQMERDTRDAAFAAIPNALDCRSSAEGDMTEAIRRPSSLAFRLHSMRRILARIVPLIDGIGINRRSAPAKLMPDVKINVDAALQTGPTEEQIRAAAAQAAAELDAEIGPAEPPIAEVSKSLSVDQIIEDLAASLGLSSAEKPASRV